MMALMNKQPIGSEWYEDDGPPFGTRVGVIEGLYQPPDQTEPCPVCGRFDCAPEDEHMEGNCDICGIPLTGKQKRLCAKKSCQNRDYYVRKKAALEAGEPEVPISQTVAVKPDHTPAQDLDMERPVVVTEAMWVDEIPYPQWGTTTTPTTILKYAKGQVITKGEADAMGVKYVEHEEPTFRTGFETKYAPGTGTDVA